MVSIDLTKRQEAILEIVKQRGPITGEHIAEALALARATLRPDLTLLTMAGYLDARPRVGYFYVGDKQKGVFEEALADQIIRDYQSVPIVIPETTSVYDAIVTMFLEDVGTLMVTREERLLGVLSRKDLLKIAIGGTDLKAMPIHVMMTRVPHVVTTHPDASLYDAAVLMIRHQVDALPVIVDEDQRVVGRVSKTTITRAFVELGERSRPEGSA